jgi:hypothetical protein
MCYLNIPLSRPSWSYAYKPSDVLSNPATHTAFLFLFVLSCARSSVQCPATREIRREYATSKDALKLMHSIQAFQNRSRMAVACI